MKLNKLLELIYHETGNLYEFKAEELSLLDAVNKLLYKLSGMDRGDELTVVKLQEFVNIILLKLYHYKSLGFVNTEVMEQNEVYLLFRSLYEKYVDVFSKGNVHSMFELEHFHNVILLILILELDLKMLDPLLSIDEIDDLKALRSKVLKNVSAPLRSSLSIKSFVKRIYTGFDTEYGTLEYGKTDLLCLTTSTYIGVFLRVKSLKLDYTITNYHDTTQEPVTSELLNLLVRLIRLVKGKGDQKIADLLLRLRSNSDVEELSLKGDKLFRFAKLLKPSDFINKYFDLTADSSFHSFRNLMDISLNITKDLFTEDILKFTSELLSVGIDVETTRLKIHKEVYLLAHFTTADISSWSDFEEVKELFSILRKCFITISNKKAYKGWKVFLRDTSLLSPTTQSLGAIGELYSDLGLNKIDLPKSSKNNMRLFMQEDFNKFKEYAIQDSVITLWHALQVEYSNYEFSNSFSIPITLSSLATNYLYKELVDTVIGRKNYHNPQVNGIFGMKSLSKVFTPLGIECCGELHEYIDYYLGSYHGGRNESFMYGVINGTFYDYDLPGAYPTAMSLIDYADWNRQITIPKMSGDDFMDKYGDYLIESYTSLKVKFQFPASVMYPNLAVRLDKGSVIYPLSGVSFCTGLEIQLALILGCKFTVDIIQQDIK